MTDNDCTPMPAAEPEPSDRQEQQRRSKIRELNDHLRRNAHGGVWRVTAGIASLPPETTRQVLKAVAVIEVAGERIIWKIDYYDRSQRYLSPDPANPKVTLRVLTVMLAHEY